MHPVIERFLSKVTALYQLEPKNLPQEVIDVLVQMAPEELFKTCTQLAVLWKNIPSSNETITLSQEEMSDLAQTYLQGIIARLKA